MPKKTTLGLLAQVTTLRPLPATDVLSLCRAVEDWPEVSRVALDHGLHGHLYQQCKQVELHTAPFHETLELLRGAFWYTTARNVQFMHVLSELGNAAADADCRFLPIQGALLQAGYYPDPGLRPMEDLDVLLLPGSHERFRKVLASCGFERVAADSSVWRRGAVVLDVHRHVVNVERIAGRGALWRFETLHLWNRAHVHSAYPDCMRFLSAADTILALTAHALKHGFASLKWLADLRIVLEHHFSAGSPELTWPHLIEQARGIGGERALCYLLYVLQVGLRMPLPSEARRWLGDQPCLDYLERRFTLGVCRFQPLPRLGDIMLAYPQPSLRQRLRPLLEVCFPHPSVLAENFPWLPQPFFVFAYLLRMFQLLGFALHALRHLGIR